MIRLTCSDRDNKITLDFAKNFTERDAIRDVLNRLQSQGANALSTAASTANNGASSGGSSGERSSPQPAAATAAPVPADELARRAKLFKHKEVVKLHAKLVRSGAVSDEDFWHAMKYRYNARGEKRPGASGRMGGGADADDEDGEAERAREHGVPSDAFTSGVHCEMDTASWKGTVPTAAQRHVVFMEHPSVAQALAAKVPAVMDEERFWKTFLQSSLAGRRRGSGPGGRLSKHETILMAEADGMLAPFQADEGETEKRERAESVKGLARSLDLERFDDHRTAHVLEGHVVGGEAPRPLKMQRGGVGKAFSTELKLMQMVNRHGALVVGEGARGNWREQADAGRPLEDLEDEEEAKFARLGVHSVKAGVAETRHIGAKIETRRIAEGIGGALQTWDGEFGRLGGQVHGCTEVLAALLDRMKP